MNFSEQLVGVVRCLEIFDEVAFRFARGERKKEKERNDCRDSRTFLRHRAKKTGGEKREDA